MLIVVLRCCPLMFVLFVLFVVAAVVAAVFVAVFRVFVARLLAGCLLVWLCLSCVAAATDLFICLFVCRRCCCATVLVNVDETQIGI